MSSTKYNFSDLGILILDDNDFAHSILRDILLSMKVKSIRHALNGADAFRAIKTDLPDIVIVDLLMAPINGFEFIKRVRAHGEDDVRHLPLLVVTAYSSMDYVTRARDIGAIEVLCKPISVAAVYDRFVYMRNSPRQFVRTEGYVGPDRRRALRGFAGMDRRTDGEASEQLEGEKNG